MTFPEFAKWPSIQRLSSETVWITEKIDGSNAIIYVPEDSSQPILAGSRNRWLTHEDGSPPLNGEDNYGFGAWVDGRKEQLRQLGPGYHYGEWYGCGIQRGYGLSTKRFASFEYWRKDIQIPDIDTVPILKIHTGDPKNVFEEVIESLITNGSTLVPGFMKPEGIVISFKNTKGRFKKLCENDKLHKSQQVAG